jgi:hypothetical protein
MDLGCGLDDLVSVVSGVFLVAPIIRIFENRPPTVIRRDSALVHRVSVPFVLAVTRETTAASAKGEVESDFA